ncbi:unnamed protein product [Protopolystoma xenopodis]|uniref:Uncharacterized protein n=1 Tax=Protopolystoma xenopodis TaxID=117903 RepID=A0A3S5CN34_9PLAT|nr:unnamed protein product [Protopolystoma xenopodis]
MAFGMSKKTLIRDDLQFHLGPGFISTRPSSISFGALVGKTALVGLRATDKCLAHLRLQYSNGPHVQVGVRAIYYVCPVPEALTSADSTHDSHLFFSLFLSFYLSFFFLSLLLPQNGWLDALNKLSRCLLNHIGNL